MAEIIDMPKRLKPEEYEAWDELFRTEQVQPQRMAEILRDNPGFADYRRRRHAGVQ